jgi:hypothetical protein
MRRGDSIVLDTHVWKMSGILDYAEETENVRVLEPT